MFWRNCPSSGSKNELSTKPVAYSLTLKMEATYSSGISVDFQQTTLHCIPEDEAIHEEICLKALLFPNVSFKKIHHNTASEAWCQLVETMPCPYKHHNLWERNRVILPNIKVNLRTDYIFARCKSRCVITGKSMLYCNLFRM
jgi:hypothetical protein